MNFAVFVSCPFLTFQFAGFVENRKDLGIFFCRERFSVLVGSPEQIRRPPP
jgi:hypothetical protein